MTQGLTIRELSKSFGNTRALHQIDLDIKPHRIHALVGENGAGKSTLIKIASGVYTADRGSVELDGKAFQPGSPADAQRAGVSIVPQELRIVPRMTAAENVFLGDWPTRRWAGIFPIVDRKTMNRKMGLLMKRIGIEIAPDTPMQDLSFAECQMLVIARALGRNAAVIILDEPTASLGSEDCERLFRILRTLCETGVAIVFVSHRLAEIENLADEVTVLRDGEITAQYQSGSYRVADLIEAMTGRDLAQSGSIRKRPPGDVALSDTSAGSQGGLADLHQGQAAGLAGLLGAGGDTLLRRIFGAHNACTIVIDGQPRRFCQPSDAIRAKIGYVPSERRLGILPQLSVAQNILLPHKSKGRRTGADAVARMITLLDIRPTDPDLPAGSLSGGNQQKVIFARWLMSDPKVLLMDEPTHGVDVAAKAQIHALIDDYLKKGGAALINSAEFAELMHLCDDVYTLKEGSLNRHFDKAADGDGYTEQALRQALEG